MLAWGKKKKKGHLCEGSAVGFSPARPQELAAAFVTVSCAQLGSLFYFGIRGFLKVLF